MNSYDKASFYLSEAKVRLFHLRLTHARLHSDMSDDLYQETIALFCKKFELTQAQYLSYTGT